MKIASWNVNSLRVRLPQVLEWLKKSNVDILAIQETKVEDNNFPLNEIEEAGFFVISLAKKHITALPHISKKPPTESIKKINQKEQDQKGFCLQGTGKICQC